MEYKVSNLVELLEIQMVDCWMVGWLMVADDVCWLYDDGWGWMMIVVVWMMMV